MEFISKECAVLLQMLSSYNLTVKEVKPLLRKSVLNAKEKRIVLDAAKRQVPFHYVYLLETSDKAKSLYCGYTTDLDRRVAAHNVGKGAKFTRARRPVKLIYWERYETKKSAMQREYQIKQLSRIQKIKLMLNPQRQITGKEEIT